MKGYWHITEWERRQIYTLLREWLNRKEIWERLWRDPSTVWREIKRNSVNWVYQPAYAQREYELRRSEINKWRRKLKNNPEMLDTIRKHMIEDRWAPHSISWRYKALWKEFVTTTTILRYIHEREPDLAAHLKYKKWYKKRWLVKTRWKPKGSYRSIEERDPIVEKRSRIWDMEIDTIHSGWSNRKGWVVTIVDRKTKGLP